MDVPLQSSDFQNFSLTDQCIINKIIEMNIIARKMILDFSAKYPDAKKPLESWWRVCKKNDFSSFSDLKKTFGTADLVGKCVIFNIGGTKYRLIVRFNFIAHGMWIKYILPHPEYDKLKLKEDSKCLP